MVRFEVTTLIIPDIRQDNKHPDSGVRAIDGGKGSELGAVTIRRRRHMEVVLKRFIMICRQQIKLKRVEGIICIVM